MQVDVEESPVEPLRPLHQVHGFGDGGRRTYHRGPLSFKDGREVIGDEEVVLDDEDLPSGKGPEGGHV